MPTFTWPRRLALLCTTLTLLACSVLVPGSNPSRTPGTSPAPTPSPPAAAATPRPANTPIVFLTNTAVPRATATPVNFVENVLGLDRRETLVLLGVPPAPASLDPALTTNSADGYIGHLYSGLVRYSPNLELEPDLAESWTVSPDGLTYTFTLRPGLTFQSGKPLTAADVQYSWERAVDPATGSLTALTYLGDIAGAHEKAAGTAGSMPGIVAVDDRTLAVTLTGPRAQFLPRLTYPVAFVLDRENVAAGDNWMFQPNASGPFVLHSLRPDQAIIFQRSPAYHTPAGVPYVAYLFAPLDVAGRLYAAGEIDMGFPDAQTAARARNPADPLHAEFRSTPALCTLMLRLDLNRPPLDDPQVRLALVLGLDRAALSARLIGPDAVTAETVLPPALPGFTAGPPRFAFDAAGARAALAASRYAGQVPPIILADRGTAANPSALGAAVAAMWRDSLGLEVTIQPLLSSVRPATPGGSHGHALVYNWCADYPDPENFLDVLFHSASDFNLAGYANPQVDAWLEAARGEPDPAARFALYQQAENQILADVAVIPWLHPTYERLVKPHVRGFVLAPMGVPIVQRVSLAWPDD